jgi:hypothetical protein
MHFFRQMVNRVGTLLKTRRSVAKRRSRPSARPMLELLETRNLMHANVVMDAEHIAVFGIRDPVTQVVTGGLVPDAAVNTRSIASGNWSDPAIWSNGVPDNGDNVLISASTVVTIDGNASIDANGQRAALRTIRDDGTLRFDPNADTTLLVDTILVTPVGTFEMGTENNPINVNHKARMIFADLTTGLSPVNQVAFDAARRAWDPLQMSLGLVSHGEISIAGSHMTSFVFGTKAMPPNTTTVDLGAAVPSDWKIGDRLIITGMTAPDAKGVNQDEEVKLTGVNGNLITLGAPLKYWHTGGAMYVANVTRNATFESENVSTVARRGHIMFMHNDDVHVSAAGLYGLGRTDKRRPIDDPVNKPDPDNPGQMTTDVLLAQINSQNPALGHRVMTPVVDANGKQIIDSATNQVVMQIAYTGLNPRGRYAVHFHRTGIHHVDEPATIDDSAVVDSPGWGIVNHSSNVDVSSNVVFNAVGAAYVTEAGDEIGSFNYNIAIHSPGSGDLIEARKAVQDFGHQGDGFWLQGGNVSLTGNVAAGQRHAGFVFFPRGLDQKGLGITTIPGESLSQYAWADPAKEYEVADIPLKHFQGNTAFASSTGFESWFTLLHAQHQDRSVLKDFNVFFTTDHGIFIPYTNHMTIVNSTVRGSLGTPFGTGIDRNAITKNIVFDHVNVQGWINGIDAPVQGKNTIVGGTFNNIRNIYVTTTNDHNRVLDINDAGPNDPMVFLNNLKVLVNGVWVPRKQQDIYLQTNFKPLFNDITKNFNADVIQLGLVSHNGQQVYYYEQAEDFTPFPSTTMADMTKFGPRAAAFVPTALLDMTNGQLFAQYGLAIGGILPPAGTSVDPLINGLVGPKATYLPDITMWGHYYYNDSKNDYKLIYAYFDPAQGKYLYVSEPTHTPLAQGWNLLTRTIAGQTRTLLVYGDNVAPTIEFAANTPTTLNKADIDNGAVLFLSANVVDDSFGKMNFSMSFKLNDPKFVSPMKTHTDGSQYVTITFSIHDFAGNVKVIKVDMKVTLAAPLIKDLNQKLLPYIDPSLTLVALLGHS